MSKNQKNICTTLNYIEHFLIWASAVTGCISISAFFSLIVIPRGITRSAIGLKICTTTAGIKKYKSIIKKKKHDKIVLFAESKLSSIEIFISNALTDYIISHNEFILVNNVLE